MGQPHIIEALSPDVYTVKKEPAWESEETYDIDELTQLQFDADTQNIGGVDNGPDEFVVVGE